MRSRLYPADATWGEVARSFPLIHQYTEQFERESVQISIWLVGLAAALMGFMATMPRSFALMPRWQVRVFVLALAFTILCGLAHRVLYQMSENRTRHHLLGLRAFLDLPSLDVTTPIELQNEWTTDEIVSRLRRYFDLDYSFLLKPESPMDFARDCFKRQYELWYRNEMSERQLLGRTLSAYSEPSGSPKELLAIYTQPSSTLDRVQRETDHLAKLINAVRLIAYACYGFFGVGVIVFVWALILVSPTLAQ